MTPIAARFLLGLSFIMATPAFGEPPIRVPPNWRLETIQLPPEFAPTMPVRGVEHLLFSPGMFDAAADDFFSYVFVLRLDPSPPLPADQLKQALTDYYQGLYAEVSQDRAAPTDDTRVIVDLAQLPSAAAEARETNYRGEIRWIEPFVTKQRQTLNIEVSVRTHAETARSDVLVSVSPRRFADSIWQRLRGVAAQLIEGSNESQPAASY